MDISRLIAWYDLLFIPNFLDDVTCRQLIQEAQARASNPATTYGPDDVGRVNDRVRKAKRLKLESNTTELVKHRLMENEQTIEDRFSISLNNVRSLNSYAMTSAISSLPIRTEILGCFDSQVMPNGECRSLYF